MNLKEIRKKAKITQKQAAELVNVPLRTYFRYENDKKYEFTLQYQKVCEIIEDYYKVDEEHGILDVEDITKSIEEVFKKYDIDFAYLFGSYAKGKAKQSSDVDILVSTKISGLKYYGIVEELREKLNKKVDMIRLQDVEDKIILSEVFKYGVKVYG